MHGSSRLIFFGVLLAVIAAVEFYVYTGLKGTFRGTSALRPAVIAYWISLGTSVAGVATMFIVMSGGLSRSNYWLNILFGLAFIFIMTKIVLVGFFLVDDIARLLQWGVGKGVAAVKGDAEAVTMPGRRKFIGQMGLVVAAIPFAGALYGILKGKYDYTLHHETLRFPDLPDAFDGFKIVQISDIHAGSFDSMDGVQRGLDLIMEQKPDLILFTGDLVNNLATEAEPYIDMFAKLAAPMGKYSVLGNHDYGSYYNWERREDMVNNHMAVRAQNARMGFEMLHNAAVLLERAGQQIALAGVENWGLPPFPQHGDLDKAVSGLPQGMFTVLMSHDPSHWDAQVRDHAHHVHLQLSGHTHGAQFGVEIPGVKFSLAQVRYKQWGGLYSEGMKHLYVNRGFGYIGFPGRVGIWPEVTLIELRKA